jgi:hypothetical protein
MHRILICCLCLFLAACGGAPKRVLGPPTISLQEVERVAGRYLARVRIDSPSSMPVTLERLDFEFRINGGRAIRGNQPLTITLPPVAGDTVTVDLAPIAALPQLEQDLDGSSINYVLEGELFLSEPKARFDVRYAGQLRPTPGKPGSFR